MPELAPGTRLGPYEILGQIGVGGMGEVYRATDTRLKRQVALKVLPSALIADPDRLARFQREAEVLASLNHPNIAGLYGTEERPAEAGHPIRALVMELVEGPTLADRIASGPIPVEEALSIARQIAEALAAAHDQNVIHRDLKPANVKLRPDGEVKVLDFGLAKAIDQGSGIGDQGSGNLANSPTMTSPAMTMPGVILGTAAYMSPEQAAGKPVDRRTDLWAFGVVLFEMLTGRQLFDGESVSHVIAAVLKDDPDWNTLPPETPPAIRRLLQRCLERDRKKRWPDAAAARMECDDALAPNAARATAGAGSAALARSSWHLAGALVTGILIAAVAVWGRWPDEPARPVTRFDVELPDNRLFSRTGRHVVAISPDGTQIAYVANRQIFLRALNDVTAASLTGTAESDPAEPIFSPDGKWLAFWSDGQLKKIPVSGGTAVTLASVDNPFGVSWTGERILLGVDSPGRILAVSANGGPATTLVTVGADESIQTPQLVNDGKAVLFALRKGDGAWQDANVVVQDLSTGQRTLLVEHGTDPRVLAAGYLIYERESTLFAMAFDDRRSAVTGSSVPVQTDVQEALGGFSGAVQAAISSSGSLVFVPTNASGSANRALVWLDRSGATERLKFAPALHYVGRSQRLSPDGTRVASRVIGSSSALSDIWIGDLDRGTFTRITFTGRATDPVWSTDGSRVCYENQDEVFCQPSDGSAGAPEPVVKLPPNAAFNFSVAADGRFLIDVPASDSGTARSRMVVVQNWIEELKAKVPR